jgi:hypothetical protein
MNAKTDPLVGVVLGGAYQLVGRIGQGGMGAVYEAHHLRLRKRVAVKVLSRAKARDGEALVRFQREATVASRLGHPNLVSVLDFGSSSDGQPYLVMEFLEGEDLDRRIRRAGVLPLPSVIRIARQVAAAVAAVHAKGIVHRDLSPANVFLVHVPGEPDFVKVLDFGVSKMKADQTRVTDASKTVGTPAYMSPEQAFGPSTSVDHRADQWALACIVWEMLSGHPPFCSDDTDALFYQLRYLSPQPLVNEVPDLPAGVEPALLRALKKQPTDRYPSIRDFVRELEIAALGNQLEAAPMSSAESTERTMVAEARLDWAIATGVVAKARTIGALVVRGVKRIDIKTRVVAAIVAGAVAGIAIVGALVGSVFSKSTSGVSTAVAAKAAAIAPTSSPTLPFAKPAEVPIPGILLGLGSLSLTSPRSPLASPSKAGLRSPSERGDEKKSSRRGSPTNPGTPTHVEAIDSAANVPERRPKDAMKNPAKDGGTAQLRSAVQRPRHRASVPKTDKGKGQLKLTIDDF